MATQTLPCSAQAPANFDDRQNMMDQLGLRSMRAGADPNHQELFSEDNANIYASTMPDPLRFKDGKPVTSPSQWWKRRKEIEEDFAREVYGRIPKHVPSVTWKIQSETESTVGGVPVITRNLVGHVDNSAYPQINVDILANFTVPAHAVKSVPIMISFGYLTGPFANFRGFGTPTGKPWTEQAIEHGWGYGTIDAPSIQPDSNTLRTAGIIGLTNKGQPRTPDQWGCIRAWQWGFSQLIDFFEDNHQYAVDPKKVGVEGLSRFGKAAIVTEAFDQRVAVGLIGSSGQGGTKLSRHIFGEAIENLTNGAPFWMAGNYMKYACDDPKKTAGDLPVDSHELIAMCAPRPCFISYGIVEKGDARWVDVHGSFMATILAGPVYRLLGKKDLGTPGNYLTDQMPPINHLIGGDLAWRQHDGGHDVTPNWPTFFEWVAQFVLAPPVS